MKYATSYHSFSFIYILVLTLSTSLSLKAFSDSIPSNLNTIFDSFYTEEVMNMTLETDITGLINNKNNSSFQKAKLSYIDIDKTQIERKIKIKVRGRYRRRICDIPPFMLKFPKKDLTADGFKDDNKFKLVTHCFEGDIQEAEQNLLKEYLIYKMLNVLTEKSFRVQLVKITYKDTESEFRLERLGVIIESTSGLGDRLESDDKKMYGLSADKLEPCQYNTFAMFQYLISNTDWQINACRNIKTFVSNHNNDHITIVPYDFDFAGLINAEYAVINPNLPPSELRERFFMGNFENEEELNYTLELFQNKKENIISLFENFELLRRRNRRDILSYIESFYEIIEDSELLKKEFLVND